MWRGRLKQRWARCVHRRVRKEYIYIMASKPLQHTHTLGYKVLDDRKTDCGRPDRVVPILVLDEKNSWQEASIQSNRR